MVGYCEGTRRVSATAVMHRAASTAKLLSNDEERKWPCRFMRPPGVGNRLMGAHVCCCRAGEPVNDLAMNSRSACRFGKEEGLRWPKASWRDGGPSRYVLVAAC